MMPVADRAARGVYEMPFLSEGGGRILVAIDNRGRRIGEVTMPPDEAKPGEYTTQLRGLLDAIDPAGVRGGGWQPRVIVGGAS